MLVDHTVGAGAFIEWYDRIEDSRDLDPAVDHPFQRQVHQPFQGPSREAPRRLALGADGPEFDLVDMKLLAQMESGGIEAIEGNDSDRAAEARGPYCLMQSGDAAGGLD